MTRVLIAALLFLVTPLSLGCAGSHTTPTEKLKLIAMRFNENIRWQRFEHASKNIPISRREVWVAAQERAAKNLRIVEYEIRPVLLTESMSILELDLTYYRMDTFVIDKERRRQVWKNKEGNWQIMSDKEHKAKDPIGPADRLPDLEAPEEEPAAT